MVWGYMIIQGLVVVDGLDRAVSCFDLYSEASNLNY